MRKIQKIKRFCCAFVAISLLLACASVRGQPNEKYCLAKTTNIFGEPSLKVVTETQYNALIKSTINDKNALARALRSAKADWISNEATKKSPFPAWIATDPKLELIGKYNKKEDAETKMNEMNALEEEDAKRKKGYLEKKIDTLVEQLNNPPPNMSSTAENNWKQGIKAEIQIHQEKLNARNAKEAVKKEAEEIARGLIQTKFEEEHSVAK